MRGVRSYSLKNGRSSMRHVKYRKVKTNKTGVTNSTGKKKGVDHF